MEQINVIEGRNSSRIIVGDFNVSLWMTNRHLDRRSIKKHRFIKLQSKYIRINLYDFGFGNGFLGYQMHPNKNR